MALGWGCEADCVRGCRTQGKAKRDCYHLDYEVPPRGWAERVPVFEKIPQDKELDAVTPFLPAKTELRLFQLLLIATGCFTKMLP